MNINGVERVTNIDEAKILGYFEGVKGTLITKFIILASTTGGNDHIPYEVVKESAEIVKEELEYECAKQS